LKNGLKDLSISRSTFSWGVKIPGGNSHVMYVWIEALTNYINALNYQENTNSFKDYWSGSLHIVGKDILRFHTIYWHSLLLAAKITPPKRVFAHGWWTNQGKKISKSIGNVIDPVRLIEKYGSDQLRYFLLRETTFGLDGNFSEDCLKARINSDLSNNLGNLVQRTLKLIQKNSFGIIPIKIKLHLKDRIFLHYTRIAYAKMNELIKVQSINKVCEMVWTLIGNANKFVNDEQPWKIDNNNITRTETIAYIFIEFIRIICILMDPIIPQSTKKIFYLINQSNSSKTFKCIDKNIFDNNRILPIPTVIFPKVS
jgi:methionyl-tRNA synthetase